MKQDGLIPGKYYTWPGAPSDGYLFVGLNKEGRAVFDYETVYHTAKSLEVDYQLVPQEKTVWVNVYKGDVMGYMHSTEEGARRNASTHSPKYLGTFPFTYKE